MSNPLIDDLIENSAIPTVDIALPTRGAFYPEGEVLAEGVNPDRITVGPISAMDESAIRDPLLLISGHAVARLIRKSCPSIVDPGALSEIDVQAILIASRMASHGNRLPITHKCQSCETETDLEIDLNEHVQQYTAYTPEEFAEFDVELPVSGQSVRLRPIRYIDSVTMTMEMVKASATVDQLTKTESETLDEDFIRAYKEQVDKTINNNLHALTSSVYFVVTKKGDKVFDPDHISEWLNMLVDKDFKTITKRVAKINDAIMKRSMIDYECQNSECGAISTIMVELDPQKLFLPAEDTETETYSSASSKNTKKTTKPRSKTSQRLS